MPHIVWLSDVDPAFDAARAASAGAASAFVYLAVMYLDMALTGSPSDDLLMLGRPFTADRARARLLGLAAHTSFGASLGLVYGALGRRALRGPNWTRGVLLLLAENALLWPLAVVADRVHPCMRSGELPRLNTPVPFAQQVARHVAFGAALGALYGNGTVRRSPVGGPRPS
jgi:hypothetical protein